MRHGAGEKLAIGTRARVLSRPSAHIPPPRLPSIQHAPKTTCPHGRTTQAPRHGGERYRRQAAEPAAARTSGTHPP